MGLRFHKTPVLKLARISRGQAINLHGAIKSILLDQHMDIFVMFTRGNNRGQSTRAVYKSQLI